MKVDHNSNKRKDMVVLNYLLFFIRLAQYLFRF
jgi:hypothetical protein